MRRFCVGLSCRKRFIESINAEGEGYIYTLDHWLIRSPSCYHIHRERDREIERNVWHACGSTAQYTVNHANCWSMYKQSRATLCIRAYRKCRCGTDCRYIETREIQCWEKSNIWLLSPGVLGNRNQSFWNWKSCLIQIEFLLCYRTTAILDSKVQNIQ